MSRGSLDNPVNFSVDPEWHDLFYGEPSTERMDELSKWLRSHKNDFVVLYHGTSARHDVWEEGLLPTSGSRAKSYQSSPGYVYLSVYPGSAETFGSLAYPMHDIIVYSVWVTVRRLKPDIDQLNNHRYEGMDVGNSLVESLVFGHGARIKGKIDPFQLGIHHMMERQ